VQCPIAGLWWTGGRGSKHVPQHFEAFSTVRVDGRARYPASRSGRSGAGSRNERYAARVDVVLFNLSHSYGVQYSALDLAMISGCQTLKDGALGGRTLTCFTLTCFESAGRLRLTVVSDTGPKCARSRRSAGAGESGGSGGSGKLCENWVLCTRDKLV